MNRIWRQRTPLTVPLISNKIYDSDFNLLVVDKNRLGVTEVFVLSEESLDQVPCSRLERLMMIISSTPHQALLLMHSNLQGNFFIPKLHQAYMIILALTYNSCPFMSLNSGSNDIGTLWNVKQLRQDKKCGLCFSETLNDWMACIRRTAMINLHIGYVSRVRQAYLLVLQIAKFLPIPSTFNGQYFKFQGPIKILAKPTNQKASMWQPSSFKSPGSRIESDHSENLSIPKVTQQKPIYAYGKMIIFIGYINNNK